MPPRHERRGRDELLVGVCLICLICTVVTAVVIAPTVVVVAERSRSNEAAGVKAVCSLIEYAETQAAGIRSSPDLEKLPQDRRARSLEAADGLSKLAADMRDTGIDCR